MSGEAKADEPERLEEVVPARRESGPEERPGAAAARRFPDLSWCDDPELFAQLSEITKDTIAMLRSFYRLER